MCFTAAGNMHWNDRRPASSTPMLSGTDMLSSMAHASRLRPPGPATQARTLPSSHSHMRRAMRRAGSSSSLARRRRAAAGSSCASGARAGSRLGTCSRNRRGGDAAPPASSCPSAGGAHHSPSSSAAVPRSACAPARRSRAAALACLASGRHYAAKGHRTHGCRPSTWRSQRSLQCAAHRVRR